MTGASSENLRAARGAGGFHLGWISRCRAELFGLAILSIMVFHFSEDYATALEAGRVPAEGLKTLLVMLYYKYIGSIGVDVFVFLSGMGLYFSYSKNEDTVSFYKRRFRRLLPTYLIVGGIYWTVKDLVLTDLGAGRILPDLIFLTFFTKNVKTIWFIGFILMMYLIFPLVYRAVKKHPAAGLIGVWLAYAVFILAFRLRAPEIFSHVEIAFRRIPIFALGAAMGHGIRSDRTVSDMLMGPLTVLMLVTDIFAIQFFSETPIFLLICRYLNGFFAMGLILASCRILVWLDGCSRFRAFLRWFGAISLELYLTHVTIRPTLKMMGFHTYRISIFACVILAAIILSPLLKKLTDQIKR